MHKVLRIFGAAMISFVMAGGVVAHADELAGYKAIPLINGPNKVRLQDHDVTVVLASRENFNAHGFTLATFYLRDKGDDGKEAWSLVPVFEKQKGEENERYGVTISGGADCVLHDMRLLSGGKSQPALLIIANREFGQSYADDAPVHFDYYELTENEEGLPGHPAFYFRATRSTKARANYCDVDDAFDKELHLGP
ncbi:carbapenem self-resistance protein CarG family protein [Dyella terrae]|uniref:carbapenem self-resistance protein CarG family protein n=1 Tax=Dyella terrae TaxID=522259 RepID=UPI001EFC9956|nr:hypothetical protein [Dyella terrae]ULU26566.1 hypothetical protein DYST_03512 [Dyella terrae]